MPLVCLSNSKYPSLRMAQAVYFLSSIRATTANPPNGRCVLFVRCCMNADLCFRFNKSDWETLSQKLNGGDQEAWRKQSPCLKGVSENGS